ncbi:MAG TPA: nitrate reductase cytochrome c-type subunit [Anaeromyxobacteraceae bacterium]|nr:nitrate reductase cytochrome c-type subunit [Anaeromyxobacteraceae bacterium]
MRTAIAALCAAALGCAASRPPAPTAAPAGPVPDTALGLAKGSVFDVPAPPPWKPFDAAPGAAPLAARPWPGAPPVVPHEIAAFLPITPASNSCVDCHAVAKKEPGQATPIPPSHYVDLRNAPDTTQERVTGARWVCTACHAERTEAKPLVQSAFVP